MSKLLSLTAAVAAALTLTACTPHPENVDAKYVSPNTYGTWNCDQLAEEHARIQSDLTRVSNLQRENANADTAMVVGSVFLWPVLLGLTATTNHQDELATLKGDYTAVEEEQRIRACTLPPPSPAYRPDLAAKAEHLTAGQCASFPERTAPDTLGPGGLVFLPLQF